MYILDCTVTIAKLLEKEKFFTIKIDSEEKVFIEEEKEKRISYAYVKYYLRVKRLLEKEAYTKIFVSIDYTERKMHLVYIYSTKQAVFSLGQKCFQEVVELAKKSGVSCIETLVFNSRIKKIILRYHFKRIHRTWFGDERFAYFLT